MDKPQYMNTADTYITKTVKFLRLIVVNTFSWSEHVELIRQKLSSLIYSLRVLKRDSNKYTIKSIYHATKILEKIMSIRIITRMMHTKQLIDAQHGYQNNESTQTAIFQFINEVHNALEDDCSPLGLFLDLPKAYDTLDYNILLEKLYLYSIRGASFQWVRSYITVRSHMFRLRL
nr:unnamed protein product [Callosobruchus analis]